MHKRTSALAYANAPTGARWGRKTLTLLLSLVLCLTLLPMAAFAADSAGTEQTHTHCLCGATHKEIVGHDTETSTTFIAWDKSDSLPGDTDIGAYYYLTQDVSLASTWHPRGGIVLCLNGHSITNTGGSTVIFVGSGRFKLTDCAEMQGKITHSGEGNGTGIYVTDGGSVDMYGGEISGNEETTGGGVEMHGYSQQDPAAFTMYGGVITGNRADQGGGVYLVGKSEFILNGGTIEKNSSEIAGDDVYLGSGTFTRNGGAFEGDLVNVDGTIGGTATTTGKYKVNFDLAGGSAPAGSTGAYQEQEAFWGAKITIPAAPEWPGWVFGGWYLDGHRFDDQSCVTKDCTLTAKWTSGIRVISDGQMVEITSENYTDVLGDGTVSYTPPSVDSNGYTQEGLERVLLGEAAAGIQPATLTLRDANLQGLSFSPMFINEDMDDQMQCLLRLINCPWLKLEGKNEIASVTLGISSGAERLIVTGDGSLHIDAEKSAVECRSYLQRSGVVTLEAPRYGINCEGNQKIQFLGGELTIRAKCAVSQAFTLSTQKQIKLWAGDPEATAILIDPTESEEVWKTVISGEPQFLRLRSPHTVTFDPNNGSTAVSAAADYGTLLAEPAAPQKSGYIFDGWYRADGTKWNFTADTVAGDATLTAKWTRVSSSGGSYTPRYTVSAEKTTNGSVAVSPRYASSGETVTVTVTPDTGFVLETLTVTDKNGNKLTLTDKGSGRFTFTMPSGSVTVRATFMDDNTLLNFFVDVKAGDYYARAVLWAAQNGITSGTDAVHFSPDAPCTRAQIVTFLWRAAGSPVVNYAMRMRDVPADAYYAEAVRWALSEGIAAGTAADTFSPDAACTRAQAVAFVYRYAASDAATPRERVSGFTDAGDIPAYALPAMNWALGAGVLQGSGSELLPNGACTRAQIVTFLYRALAE